MAVNQLIRVMYRDREVGLVGYDPDRRQSSFQYHSDFLNADPMIELFPYGLRKVKNTQIFSGYEGDTFRGLPPFIADSLPDYFGNLVFTEWFESQRKELALNPLEQLAYVGKRGMGALEFLPEIPLKGEVNIDLKEITEVAKKVVDIKTTVSERAISSQALFNIFRIGTSAGGARPKILVSENKKTRELIPGDLDYSNDFNHYIIKLGIEEEGYSKEKIEYIYYQLARRSGIEMMPSKLIQDRHFATLRFDRKDGRKIHMLTASGLTGWDFRETKDSSYENLFKLAIDLKLGYQDIQQLFRRMLFNLMFANTDDHLKNFSFLLDEETNRWKLTPAYDLTFALNPLFQYTRISRACSIRGKRSQIEWPDIEEFAQEFSIKDLSQIKDEIRKQQEGFKELADQMDVPKKIARRISSYFQTFS